MQNMRVARNVHQNGILTLRETYAEKYGCHEKRVGDESECVLSSPDVIGKRKHL